MATRQGTVLHIATTGIDWTGNGGNRWQKLNVPASNYYPRSVRAADDRIYKVFLHVVLNQLEVFDPLLLLLALLKRGR